MAKDRIEIPMYVMGEPETFVWFPDKTGTLREVYDTLSQPGIEKPSAREVTFFMNHVLNRADGGSTALIGEINLEKNVSFPSFTGVLADSSYIYMTDTQTSLRITDKDIELDRESILSTTDRNAVHIGRGGDAQYGYLVGHNIKNNYLARLLCHDGMHLLRTMNDNKKTSRVRLVIPETETETAFVPAFHLSQDTTLSIGLVRPTDDNKYFAIGMKKK
ncbi:MAG: hypothetical protein WCK90_01810 [archaeon]